MDPGAPRARRLPPLELIVFVVGSSTLGAEIAAARLMAPFFGASTVVWANTIAVVLMPPLSIAPAELRRLVEITASAIVAAAEQPLQKAA